MSRRAVLHLGMGLWAARSDAQNLRRLRFTRVAGIIGTAGVWTNVTPVGISLNPDSPANNYGVQGVAVDPVRPQDFYTTADFQGIWKSTDYGLTWASVSATFGQWTTAIESTANRNPTLSPYIYTSGGFGVGIRRSHDFGATWAGIEVNNFNDGKSGGYEDDIYQVIVDPTNGAHLLCTFHAYPGVSESFDNGSTWAAITMPAGIGSSLYVFFTNPSAAEITGGASTSTTWLTISQLESGEGMWRTVNSGMSWAKVNTLQHTHGNSQMFTAGGGVVYAAGSGGSSGSGVYRSTDNGVTWTLVNDGTVQNGVYGTANYLYADYGWAYTGTQGQTLQRAARSTGTSWSTYSSTPGGMTNGSMQAAVSTDGIRTVIVTGNRIAGLWRYIE